MPSIYNIFDNFEEMHVATVWAELKERFNFNIKGWKKAFEEYLSKQPRNTHELDAFLKFGNAFINPVLNQILYRHSHHNTFNNLVEYILKKYPSKNQRWKPPTTK